MDYTKHITTAHQQERARADQVENSAGGYVFQLTPEQRFMRFLILGTEGGSYYASERQQTREAVQSLDDLIAGGGGDHAVRMVVEVSKAGRAPKNDPAIFALAYLARNGTPSAYRAVTDVCRTGTHLFQWVDTMKKLGSTLGSGGARRAINRWYKDRAPGQLALQVTKYRQRSGWTHRDVMLLGHVRPPQGNDYESKIMRDVLTFAAKPESIEFDRGSAEELELIYAYQELQKATTTKRVVKLIRDFQAPRELVPTQFLNHAEVWEALLSHMPMTATVRNLGKMSAVGLLKPLSDAAKLVCERLGNQEQIIRSRMHPVQVLAALKTYGQGRGHRGSLEWEVVSPIVDALEDAFYLAFGNVKSSGKRMLLALDVSGSMSWGHCAGLDGLTPAEGAAAMALVTARTEPNYHIMGFAHELRDLGVSARDTLQDALRKTSGLSFGRTDCALPFIWAQRNRVDVDGFVVYTDSETWAGHVHPFEALREYRQRQGVGARSVVVGMEGNPFTIADPRDGGMLDVVGFDTAAPQLISDFVAGGLER